MMAAFSRAGGLQLLFLQPFELPEQSQAVGKKSTPGATAGRDSVSSC